MSPERLIISGDKILLIQILIHTFAFDKKKYAPAENNQKHNYDYKDDSPDHSWINGTSLS